MKKEQHYQLTLLLRSVYLRGQADANRKTVTTEWEHSIIKQIEELFKTYKEACLNCQGRMREEDIGQDEFCPDDPILGG